MRKCSGSDEQNSCLLEWICEAWENLDTSSKVLTSGVNDYVRGRTQLSHSYSTNDRISLTAGEMKIQHVQDGKSLSFLLSSA